MTPGWRRRLAHYVRPYWVQATVSALAVSLKSLSDVIGPYLVKVAIDRYLTGQPGPATSWLTRHLPADPYRGITGSGGHLSGRAAVLLFL